MRNRSRALPGSKRYYKQKFNEADGLMVRAETQVIDLRNVAGEVIIALYTALEADPGYVDRKVVVNARQTLLKALKESYG